MRKDIHPENYRLVAFKDMSNDDVFLSKSTADTKETIEVDGVEYPLVKLEISRKGFNSGLGFHESFFFFLILFLFFSRTPLRIFLSVSFSSWLITP